MKNENEIIEYVNNFFFHSCRCPIHTDCKNCIYLGTPDERIKKYNELKKQNAEILQNKIVDKNKIVCNNI